MGSGQEEMQLVERISEIYESISKLDCLSPSMEVNKLFTELVHACIPVIPVDVSELSSEVQSMRTHLIKLSGEAEGLMENHYSDILATFDNPLDHLDLFPYYNNYLKLSHLEFTLLSRYVLSPPRRVAFVGSGPLPLSSIVLAARHMPAPAYLDNYDLDADANARARRLVRGDPALAERMTFHTADVMDVPAQALRGYDVLFLAALVGIAHDDKMRVVEHLARNMAPGALLVARSANGARAFLYPVVEPAELKGFEVLTVHHPTDEVINSVIVARKLPAAHSGAPPAVPVMWPCKCCEKVQGFHHFGHGSIMEEVALEELPS
ncbi:nicotianamine synthase 3-like [Canna indica]|uniref:Nicotianamine synthase n=1 Tax=Canna indica TaxID=4628 RepID=A0AAQ3Q8E8_9LILI|nr:nicotianamine synthase 3-like [Canna indica]